MPLALNFLRKEHFDSVATMLGRQKELFFFKCSCLPGGLFVRVNCVLASAF